MTWIFWLVGLCFAIDAARRPQEQWLDADRDKSFWVAMLFILSLAAAIPYCIGVLPRLLRSSQSSAEDPFRKN